MKKNDLITVTIERLGGECGIAHEDGRTLFVQNALPGETVRALTLKVDKSVAFLKTVEVLTPSPDRVTPPCPYYARCGGCVCQHMTYETSLDMKRQRVRDALKRIGGIEMYVPPVIGMEHPWRYRNKTTLPVAGVAGAPEIGFYAPRSHRVVPVDGCLIAKEESDTLLNVVRAWMLKFGIEPYNEMTRGGTVRHVMSRVSRAGEVMAVIVAATDKLPHETELIGMTRAALPSLVSLCLNVNRRGDNVILSPDTRTLYGGDRLNDTLCGLSFALSPLSFFQINPEQTERLYNVALDFAALQGNETVFDLYCGAGTISLLLASRCKRVIGVEIVREAIDDARENAARNHVTNVEFNCAAVEQLLPRMAADDLRPDVIVLDPPRKGVEGATVAAIAQSAPTRVVYVSCDPATQARDAKALCALGYRTTKTQSVDMFCHTAHVENVLLFERED